jgi:hypothetical protein
MIITKTGFYRLTADYSSRSSGTISHMQGGTTIQITQVDNTWNKVIGPELLDWEYNDIPCEPASDPNDLIP